MDYVNKNSNDTIRYRTRDLPACTAVPQSTTPLRAHQHTIPSYILLAQEHYESCVDYEVSFRILLFHLHAWVIVASYRAEVNVTGLVCQWTTAALH
jgi:hypothetical protein